MVVVNIKYFPLYVVWQNYFHIISTFYCAVIGNSCEMFAITCQNGQYLTFPFCRKCRFTGFVGLLSTTISCRFYIIVHSPRFMVRWILTPESHQPSVHCRLPFSLDSHLQFLPVYYGHKKISNLKVLPC